MKNGFKDTISSFIMGSLIGIVIIIVGLTIIGAIVILPFILHFTGTEYQSISSLILFSMIMNVIGAALERFSAYIQQGKTFHTRGKLISGLNVVLCIVMLIMFELFLDWLMDSIQLTFASIFLVAVLLTLLYKIGTKLDKSVGTSDEL